MRDTRNLSPSVRRCLKTDWVVMLTDNLRYAASYELDLANGLSEWMYLRSMYIQASWQAVEPKGRKAIRSEIAQKHHRRVRQLPESERWQC
jgi:hypothetical protein